MYYNKHFHFVHILWKLAEKSDQFYVNKKTAFNH